MKGLRSIVPLPRESMRGITPSPIVGEEPVIEWVNPLDLYVEEGYQRDVGQNGTALIRRIVAEFSWHKFKTPICFRAPEFDGAIVVVDGQHTSIGCATRGIPKIPVAVYANASAAERAAAFVAHNRDRVALTMQAIFKADLAAGDSIALAANAACEAAGAKVLTYAINLTNKRPVGETMAVGTIRAMVRKFGPAHLTRVMKVLVAAGRGPIKAQEISAASAVLLHGDGKVNDLDAKLVAIVRSKGAKAWAARAAQEAGTLPQALTTLWTRQLDARAAAPAPPPVKQIPEPVKRPVEPVKPAAPVAAPKVEAPTPRRAVFLTQTNGISVTLEGAVARAGWQHTVHVGATGAKLVARLVSVMPANIPLERLAQHVFEGRPNARVLLDDLVFAVSPDLRKVGLEIYRHEKTALMIRDANSGENLLRA